MCSSFLRLCVFGNVLFGVRVPELLLIFNLCAFNWNSAGASALGNSPLNLAPSLAVALPVTLTVTVTVTVTHLPRQTRIASHWLSSGFGIAHRTRPTSCKQVVAKIASNINFRTFSGCVRQAHATRNQKSASGCCTKNTTKKNIKSRTKERVIWPQNSAACLLAANLLR